jgi:uncharacterized protein YjiS (DUF1127 family)
MTTNANDFAAINGFYDTLPRATTLSGWARTRIERRALRAAVRTLQGMDDRMLADIGMRRGEIHSLVYGGDSDPTRRSWTIV